MLGRRAILDVPLNFAGRVARTKVKPGREAQDGHDCGRDGQAVGKWQRGAHGLPLTKGAYRAAAA